jgi:putative endonuclease
MLVASRSKIGRVTGSSPAGPTKAVSKGTAFFATKMYHTYILYSKISDRYYIGSTGELSERLIKHNSRHKDFTGQATDWEIIYSEPYSTKSEALKREKEIKRWKSRAIVEWLVKSKQ